MATRMTKTRRYHVAATERFSLPSVVVEYTEGDTLVAVVSGRRDLNGTDELDELIETLQEVRLHVAAAEQGKEPPE